MSSPSTARRKRLVIPASITAFAVVGAGTLATTALFTDTATVDNNTFTAGSVSLTTDPVKTVFQAYNMAPGDVITAPLTVKNDGSLELRYAMTSTATGELAAALTLQVKAGVADCTNTGFAADGTNLYGSGSIGNPTGMKVFGDSQTGHHDGDRVLASSASEVLCAQVTLPGEATGNDYQVKSADVTFTFNSEQTKNNGAAGTEGETNTPNPVVKPQAPKGFAAAVATTDSYTLTWTNPTGVAGVYIYRSSDGANTWTKVADVPAPTTTWTDDNPGEIPSYAVVSYNSAGTTSGNPGSTSTPTSTPPPLVSASGKITLLDTNISHARLVAADSTTIYSAMTSSESIWRTDIKSGVTTRIKPSTAISVGSSMTLGPDGFLYIAPSGSTKSMYRVNPDTGATTASMNTANSISGGTFGSDGKMYVLGTLSSGQSVLQYDRDTSRFTTFKTHDIFAGYPTMLTAGPDGVMYGVGSQNLFTYDLAAKTFVKSNLTSGGTAKYVTGNGAALTYGPDGYLYAANSGEKTIVKINPSTGVVTTLTSFTQGIETITVAPNGTLYVTSPSYSSIYSVDPETGDKEAVVVGMTAMASTYGDDNALYTISHNSNPGLIVKTDPITGDNSIVATGLNGRGLTWGADGMLYATSMDENAVYRVNPTTGTSTKIATLTRALSITYGTDGNLYVVAGDSLSVYRVDPTTGTSTLVGRPSFTKPTDSGIAYGPDGFLYVGSTGLYKMNPTTGASTQLNSVSGISGISISGTNIFVANTGTNTVLKGAIGGTTFKAVATYTNLGTAIYSIAAGKDGYAYLSNRYGGLLYKMAQ